MKYSTWIAIGVYAFVVLIGSTALDAPWWVFLPLPVAGALVQLFAVSSDSRWLGFLMTVLGVVLLYVGIRSDLNLREKVWQTRLQYEIKQMAEQRAAPVPSASQAEPSVGAR